MKRFVCILIFAIFIITFTTQVAAHHYKSSSNAVSSYTACALEDCVKTGSHIHNKTTYTAHYYNDGHDYHDYCEIKECEITGYHEHDSIYYFQHSINDGHDYHDYCIYSDCISNSYHEHEGLYCFAYKSNNYQHNRKIGTCHR